MGSPRNNKDCSILGSTLGSPCFEKLPYHVHVRGLGFREQSCQKGHKAASASHFFGARDFREEDLIESLKFQLAIIKAGATLGNYFIKH